MRLIGYNQNMFSLEVEMKSWAMLKTMDDMDADDSFDQDELQEDARIMFPTKYEGWIKLNDKVIYDDYVENFDQLAARHNNI